MIIKNPAFLILAVNLAFSFAISSNLASSSLSIPTSLYWGNVNGTSYLTVSRNQKSLQYCTGSWAIAATTVLSDRFKVLRNASWPDYNIAPQVALSCISQVQGCHEEGDPALVYDYISKNGITDETCAVYQGLDFSNGNPCGPYSICLTCLSQTSCFTPSRYYLYNITGYSVAKGEDQMLSALQSGPIVCRLNNTIEFEAYSSKDNILVPGKFPSNGTIYVSIVGYGVDSAGTNYWIGRNSWGTTWGDLGFFNLIRGTDALGIEEYCVYPTPNLTVTVVTTKSQGIEERTFIDNFELPKLENEPSSFRIKPEADEALAAVPSAWDWRNANGTNYLSWVRNQNLPQYTTWSWILATASSISDRVNIMFYNATFTPFTMSIQDLLDETDGMQEDLYSSLQYGISDDTCRQYVGGEFVPYPCLTCVPPAPQYGSESNCKSVTPPFLYRISSYKNLAGATKMMQEIYTNGPITCGIYSSIKFLTYSGGIYSEISAISKISQYVSVVGWGVDPSTKTQYWIGRNSWGTFWGEYGFFRIQMFRDNLGIETDCVSAVPTFKKK